MVEGLPNKMSEKITASQAKYISDCQCNKNKDYQIQVSLSKIYSYINNGAKSGSYSVELESPNYENDIIQILKSDGYTVKKITRTSYRDMDETDEFMVISWRNVSDT